MGRPDLRNEELFPALTRMRWPVFQPEGISWLSDVDGLGVVFNCAVAQSSLEEMHHLLLFQYDSVFVEQLTALNFRLRSGIQASVVV